MKFTEAVDTAVAATRDARYSNKVKTMAVKISVADNRSRVFHAKSHYNSLWSAYETNRLLAQWKLAEDRYEHVQLSLDEDNNPTIATYTRDASYTIFGAQFGEADVTCENLKLTTDQSYNEERPSPAFSVPIFLPY